MHLPCAWQEKPGQRAKPNRTLHPQKVTKQPSSAPAMGSIVAKLHVHLYPKMCTSVHRTVGEKKAILCFP